MLDFKVFFPVTFSSVFSSVFLLRKSFQITRFCLYQNNRTPFLLVDFTGWTEGKLLKRNSSLEMHHLECIIYAKQKRLSDAWWAIFSFEILDSRNIHQTALGEPFNFIEFVNTPSESPESFEEVGFYSLPELSIRKFLVKAPHKLGRLFISCRQLHCSYSYTPKLEPG